MKRSLVAVAGASTLLIAASLLSGCSSSANSSSAKTITIGASIPLTGSLAPFGPLIKDGYTDAVKQVNDAGGISIGGTKEKVNLVIQDNKSDSDTAGSQARNLILDSGAVALLGSVSPPLTVPVSNVAEQQRVPFVTALTPLEAWLAANKSGWNYSWDMFFDENTMTNLQFAVSDLTDTNKKIALFTDNEEDGVVMGKIWSAKAPSKGYTIASHASFPVGTTDYSSFIADAKAADAQVVIAQMTPPDAFALWKQMKALSFSPKVAFCEKCGATQAFPGALGDLAEGTSAVNYYQPTKQADAVRLTAEFGPKVGNGGDLAAIIISESAAKVLLDAIAKAGSIDPKAINSAIGATSGSFAIGPVKFAKNHSAPITPIESQWQGGKMVQILPKTSSSGTLEPVKGLE